MLQKEKTDRAAVLSSAALLTAVFLWGGSFSAMRQVLKVLNPWSVMWLRMTLATLAVLPFLGRVKRPVRKKGDWKLLLPMVLFQPCLYFLLEANALCLTTSSQAGVISASVPVLVSLGAFLFLGETLSPGTWTGLGLSVGGVVFLTLLNGPGEGGDRILLGNLLELGAMICAAANMLIIKQMSSRYNPWILTAWQSAAGAVFFLPGLFLLIKEGQISLIPSLLPLFLYLGVFVSLGAFGLYNWGMSRMPASGASSFINLVPVTAVFLGWSLLGESLNPLQCGASVLVIGGVWLSQRTGRADRFATTRRNASSSSGSKRRPFWSFRKRTVSSSENPFL